MRCVEDRGYLWLSMVEGLPVSKKYEILDAVGGISELYINFYAHTSEITEILGNHYFAKMNLMHDEATIDQEIARLKSLGIHIVTIDDEKYPLRLKDIPTAPLLLYYKGNIEVLSEENMISVVGSRTPSRYGKDATRLLVRDLTRQGMSVVSGLARGVDTIAHRTTLENDGVTIAVVANGLDICYPAENHELLEMICEKGVVISEYQLGAKPLAFRFPERNRIISGLSKGTLVTEAGKNSGSLITMNSALEQGRNVYIVPGPINTPSAYGSNEAIKELQGAMVTSYEDIIKDYDIKVNDVQEESIELSEIESKLNQYIQEDMRHIDEIGAYMSELSTSELLAVLSKLEIFGLIRRLPGNYYGK